MSDREHMGDFDQERDPPPRRTWEDVQRDWVEADAEIRELELFLAERQGRKNVLEQLARQEELAARRRLWPF